MCPAMNRAGNGSRSEPYAESNGYAGPNLAGASPTPLDSITIGADDLTIGLGGERLPHSDFRRGSELVDAEDAARDPVAGDRVIACWWAEDRCIIGPATDRILDEMHRAVG